MAGITAGLRSLLDSGKYSDFKITCKGVEFKVHKAIICSASDFFSALCESGFKEQDEGTADLPDNDPDTVKRMIDFIYTGVYNAQCPVQEIESMISGTAVEASSRSSEHSQTTADMGEPDGHQIDREEVGFRSEYPVTESARLACLERLRAHIMVYLIADKFDIQQLKTYALLQFREGLVSLNAPAFDIRASSGFADLLTFAYESTSGHDYGIRAELTRACILCGSTWNGPIQAVDDVAMKHEPMAFRFGREMQGRYGVWSEPLRPARHPADNSWEVDRYYT